MRMRSGGGPVTNISTPTVGRPESVADVDEAFERAIARRAEVEEELLLGDQVLDEARAADLLTVADAVVNGKPSPKNPRKLEQETASRIADLEQERQALDGLIDVTGSALVKAIDNAKAEWLDAVRPKLAESVSAYREAVTALRAAAADVAELQATAEWLAAFDARQVAFDDGVNFHGGRRYSTTVPASLLRDRDGDRNYTVRLLPLIDALAKALDAKAEPQPQTHTVAAASEHGTPAWVVA